MRKLFILLLCLLCLVPSASAAETEKYVALTFDDGPSGRYTQTLLEGLEVRGAKATFFLCGCRLEEYPELAQQILAGGHEIGLHGYSHRSMEHMSRRDIAGELADTRALLPEGCTVRFLRSPGGCCSDGVRQVAEATRLAILEWSVDPRDWAARDAAAMGSRLVNQVRDGDVVLLRDVNMSSVSAALALIDRLQKDGFQFVTVSELAKIRNVKIKSGQIYDKFLAETEAEGYQ